MRVHRYNRKIHRITKRSKKTKMSHLNRKIHIGKDIWEWQYGAGQDYWGRVFDYCLCCDNNKKCNSCNENNAYINILSPNRDLYRIKAIDVSTKSNYSPFYNNHILPNMVKEYIIKNLCR